MFIRDDSIQYGILDRTFQTAYFTAGLQVEYPHNFFSVYRRLEIAYPVFFFQVFQFLAYQFEVIQEFCFRASFFVSDVRFAQHHQVVNIISGFKKQTSHGGISYYIICDNNGTHVQAD